jgi:transposase InsO family protein
MVTTDATSPTLDAVTTDAILSTVDATPAGPRRAWRTRNRAWKTRGMHGQRRQREAERAARYAAVVRAEELRREGAKLSTLAEAFGVVPRTLLRWTNLVRTNKLETKALGRAAKRGPRHARLALLRDLSVCPHVGVPTLRARHRDLGVREIEELAGRFRSVRTTRERDTIEALTWHQPGSVWAVDFSDAGLDIEGTFPYLLLVRDLSTGYTLLSLPCLAQDAATVCAALDALFASEGAPLVLKADNGSGFIAAATVQLLATHEVLLLRSPPGTPAFNGACEAGVGSIKTRAHHLAAARGRVTCWSCDDVEAARVQANETWRTRLADPTPGERWRARTPLSRELRASLRTDVAARTSAGLLELEGDVEDRVVQEVVRAAIAGSLRAHSLLSSRLETIPARRGPRRTDVGEGQPEGVTSST